EHKAETAGLFLPLGNSLLGAAALRGIAGGDPDDKKRTQKLLADEANWPDLDVQQVLTYCEKDVRVTGLLLDRMAPLLSLDFALMRGEFVRAIGLMAHTGIPLDGVTWDRLLTRWDEFRRSLIAAVDPTFGVYADDHFSMQRFAELLERHGILQDWPRTDTGR